MNEAVKVSVVLPVYNVEAFLKHSLSCLVNQTLREMEIICVDDGSTDASVRVVQNFMERDPRIKLFLNEHSYAGVARNTGLEHALGKWVMFLDPDDYYDVTMLEELYSRAEASQVDVLLCGVWNAFPQRMNYSAPSQKPLLNCFFNGKIFNASDLGNDVWSLIVYPYNKLYRRDFLNRNQIRFQAIQNTNDASFAFETIIAAEKMTLIDKAYYYYRHSRPGNTRTTKGDHLECVIQAYEHSYERCKRYPFFQQCQSGFYAIIIFSYVWHFREYATDGEETKRFYFDHAKNFIKTHFDHDADVQECLKYYFLYYCVARIMSRHTYKKACKILNMKGVFKTRVKYGKMRHCFLGIPFLQRTYTEGEHDVFRFLGLPLLHIRYEKGFKKTYLFGIRVARSRFLHPFLHCYLCYVSNRLKDASPSIVICVFGSQMIKEHPKENLLSLVRRIDISNQKVHFITTNNREADLLKNLLTAYLPLSISAILTTFTPSNLIYYPLRNGLSFHGINFFSATI